MFLFDRKEVTLDRKEVTLVDPGKKPCSPKASRFHLPFLPGFFFGPGGVTGGGGASVFIKLPQASSVAWTSELDSFSTWRMGSQVS